MTASPASSPIPGGVLTVDDEPNPWGRFYVLDLDGWCVGEVTNKQRARLLAGPPRPDGVPDGAALEALESVIHSFWLHATNWMRLCSKLTTDERTIVGTAISRASARLNGMPVPPYQPVPDPAERPETVREHFNGHCCADDPECEHSFMDVDELERHMASAYQPDPDPADGPTEGGDS